jgi:hypothetical protein
VGSRWADYGNLEIAITVNDPKAYTRPWTVVAKQVAVLDTDLLDAICLEKEKDLPHLRGSDWSWNDYHLAKEYSLFLQK